MKPGNFRIAGHFAAKILSESVYTILRKSWKNGSFSNIFKIIFQSENDQFIRENDKKSSFIARHCRRKPKYLRE